MALPLARLGCSAFFGGAFDCRALAAARAPSLRRFNMASACGAPNTIASKCLQKSGSPLISRNSARKG
jgi:hypothetical protein